MRATGCNFSHIYSLYVDDEHEITPKADAMAERVKIDGGGGENAEFIHEIALALQDLACNALAAGHIDVGLEVPAAHDMPFSCLDKNFDLLKKRGVVFLYVFVDRGLVVAEHVIELSCEVDGGAKGGKHHARALLPIPLPDRVDVSVADQMYLFHENLLIS